MTHPLTSLVKACHSFVQKTVLALANESSSSPRTTSIVKPTPSTASEMSAKSAIELSVESPVPHYDDAQALQVAGNVISLWKPSSELVSVLTEQDAGQLVRLLAEALQMSTAEASHIGAVTTANRLVRAQQQLAQPDGAEQLHYHVLLEEKRVDGLLYLLREVNRFMLAQAGALNEMVEMSDDEHVQERLITMRQTLLANESAIDDTIHRTEAGRYSEEGD